MQGLLYTIEFPLRCSPRSSGFFIEYYLEIGSHDMDNEDPA
jgi:hypothetical protein